MPNTRLVFMPRNLNDSNETVASGLVEPITGLELTSGLNRGQFTDWTDSEVARYTNTAVGTLYAGRYMRVRMDPAAATLKRGQLLWWLAGSTFKHTVTNVEPADLTPLAGIFLNTDASGSFPVTAGNYCWIQVFGVGGQSSVLLKTVLTGVPAVGQSLYAAGAGAGADNATADVLDAGGNPTFTDTANMDNRFIGKAMVIPVGGTIIKVSLPGRMDVD